MVWVVYAKIPNFLRKYRILLFFPIIEVKKERPLPLH